MVSEIPMGTQSNVLPDVEHQLEQIARLFLAHHRPELPDIDTDELIYLGMGIIVAACLRIAIDRPPQLNKQRLIDRTATLLTTGLFLQG